MTVVSVLGGGIGGLSAAHELAERGFSVTVYEQKDSFGGKARSLPGPETSGGTHLPAEHGFRFFPGFYQHVTDTLSRIPYGDGSVKDNLVETQQIFQSTSDRQWTMSTSTPDTLREHRDTMWALFGGPDVPTHEKAFFLSRLFQILTSCDRRLREQYEETSWWDFTNADRMSPGYQKILGRGISQSLVALRPEMASTRTMGRIYLQLIQGVFDESMEADYVLNGPTNDVWIDPWVAHLENLGVELRSGATVQAIESDGSRVTGVVLREDGSERTVTADYYVAALPVEAMITLLEPELEQAAPSLRGISELETAWMNGVQFYLDREVPIAHGHGIYYDSPWAITTISQNQFWDEYDLDRHGDGVKDVLSVVISDWNRPGVVYDKPARECSPEQIKEEVWTQLEAHLHADGETVLTDELLVDWFLDPAIQYDEDGNTYNLEPLLINTVGSLRHRPEAATDADNLVLASDYVRTNTDLTTMEGANEAARRAVNAILDRSGSDEKRCHVGDLTFPPGLERFRTVDSFLYRSNLPHPGSAAPCVWNVFDEFSSLIGTG